MCSALPETFPSKIIINKTISATECNTNQQHHMTQDLKFSLWSKCKRLSSLCRDTFHNELHLPGKVIQFDSKWNYRRTAVSIKPIIPLRPHAASHHSTCCTDLQWSTPAVQWQTDKLKRSKRRGSLWVHSHLSGFGWGLNKGNAVAAC